MRWQPMKLQRGRVILSLLLFAAVTIVSLEPQPAMSGAISLQGDRGVVAENQTDIKDAFELWSKFGSNDGYINEILKNNAATPLQPSDLSLPPDAEAAGMMASEFDTSEALRMMLELSQFTVRAPDGMATCSAHNARAGTLRGLLIGVSDYESIPPLAGPSNDVELIRKSLIARGARAEDIVVLTGAVKRQEAISEMKKIIGSARCHDQVLFHYSGVIDRNGIGRPYPVLAFTDYVRSATNQLKIDPDGTIGDDVTTALTAVDLSDFIAAIRNRGAEIVVTLDGSYAAGLRLGALQQLWRRRPQWIATRGDPDALHEVPRCVKGSERCGQPGNRQLETSHSDFAVLYASGRFQLVNERQIWVDGKERVVGLFSYALAKALQNPGALTVKELARQIAVDPDLASQSKQVPFFEASNPEIIILDSNELDVTIESPPQTRGMLVVESTSIPVVGHIGRPERVLELRIDGERVALAPDGRFEVELKLDIGTNTVEFMSLTRDDRVRRRAVEVEVTSEVGRISKEGQRYALVIGNWDYAHESYPDLATPENDAREVARILRDRYQFATKLVRSDGQSLDLEVINATKFEIEERLDHLHNMLSERDTLLIYYAGHGDYRDNDPEPYWMPVDADPTRLSKWLRVSSVTNYMASMRARKVLLVADSCYSGRLRMLTQANDDAANVLPPEELMKKRSRIVIASGGNEPVSDTGGGKHSIFARKFIDGLVTMTGRRSEAGLWFTSSELFASKVQIPVAGNAKQIPERMIPQASGHDGGDFVFFRSDTTNAASDAGQK